ncbi:hypothetical protein TNCV_2005811 [Trichonephila clavipes]|nr:hypothetical protein TNCV_2005811 [Trichonephila clavipes]
MRTNVYSAHPVFVTLGAEVHKQMFRSGGQSDAKSSLFSSQASLILIYRPTEDMKGGHGHELVNTGSSLDATEDSPCKGDDARRKSIIILSSRWCRKSFQKSSLSLDRSSEL